MIVNYFSYLNLFNILYIDTINNINCIVTIYSRTYFENYFNVCNFNYTLIVIVQLLYMLSSRLLFVHSQNIFYFYNHGYEEKDQVY